MKKKETEKLHVTTSHYLINNFHTFDTKRNLLQIIIRFYMKDMMRGIGRYGDLTERKRQIAGQIKKCSISKFIDSQVGFDLRVNCC